MPELPNFHIGVPPWVLFLAMLGDVGLVTFGDPTAFGAPGIATPAFKAVVAMFGVALAVMVAVPAPAPSAAEPPPAQQHVNIGQWQAAPSVPTVPPPPPAV